MDYLKSLLVAAIALIFLDVSAAEIDATAAQAVAESLLQSRLSGKMRAGAVPTLKLAHAEPSSTSADVVDYYVFNTTDGGAFVIVAGDDCAEQVLGYGDGMMDMDNLPTNVRWWLNEYKRQIEWLRALPDEKIVTGPRRSAADDITVEPMLTCKWSQETPYNDQCAMYQGLRCVTGCVATAMAQVMYYWKYPEVLPALPAYVSCTRRIPIEALPGVTADWDNMLDVYSRGYTEEQGAAVATLMRYCSQGCFMDCSTEGSASSGFEQLMAFKQFGYNQLARHLERNDYSAEEWIAMINADLTAGHPIPYCGRGEEGGHAFVLDGCADGKYHFNWGWGGAYDGYFVLDLLVPYKDIEFSYDQDMNYQICPDDGSPASVEPAYDFEVDGIYYLKNGTEATVTYRNLALNSYSGEVEIPETVTHDGLTYQVTAIGELAFSGCSGLTSVKLPFIERVDDYAFTYSPNLQSITVGKAFTFLGSAAFYGVVGLNRLEVEDVGAFASNSFDYYGDNPLYYAGRLYHHGEELTDVVVPGNIKRVGNYAFICCENIKSVIIEEGVDSIGEYAFYGCPALERMEIGAANIGLNACLYESSLTELTFREGVKQIGESAFYGCSGIKSLVMPASLDSIKYAAFAYCDGVESLEFKGGDVSLNNSAFYGLTSMNDLKLSPTQTSIGMGVFGACTSLQNIDWGERIDSIGDYAFYDCTGLSEITFPATVTHVGESAFSGCSGLSRVNISDLKTWCAVNFANASANPLTNARHLFVGGEEITELVIPEGITSIGTSAFSGGSSITSVTIPSSVTTIGPSAFLGCTGLIAVHADDLKSWCAINYGNESSNPVSNSRHLFIDGQEVTALTIPDGVTSIANYAFIHCEGLTSVAMSDDVESIGKSAFHLCKNLARVTVGDGVKAIGEKAFSTCTSLKDVTLGSGVENIDSKAFTSCMIISDIACLSETPPVLADKNCFSNGVYKKAVLTVPSAGIDAYRSDPLWAQFVNITELMPDCLAGDVNCDGEVNVADINAALGQILGKTQNGNADVNGDGEVTLADVNAVIDKILNK